MLPPISDLVTSEMINDVKTEADRCDKDNVEWLINLVGRRKWGCGGSRDLLV